MQITSEDGPVGIILLYLVKDQCSSIFQKVASIFKTQMRDSEP